MSFPLVVFLSRLQRYAKVYLGAGGGGGVWFSRFSLYGLRQIVNVDLCGALSLQSGGQNSAPGSCSPFCFSLG